MTVHDPPGLVGDATELARQVSARKRAPGPWKLLLVVLGIAVAGLVWALGPCLLYTSDAADE